jgi:hypothetical protein
MQGEGVRSLPVREVIAKNYGAEHTNKIHSDEGAAHYGFGGALVPGVGLYAYLIGVVVERWGHEWLERGAMTVKFIKPIYDGERVTVRGGISSAQPHTMQLEMCNAAGTLCANGTANLPTTAPPLDPRHYPHQPLPTSLRPPNIANFAVGEALGTHEFTVDLADEMTGFLDNVVETLPLYRHADEAQARICHPAFLIAQANEVLMHNIALGSWIHVASRVQHYALAEAGERVAVRGRVQQLYEKRGHAFMVADLAMFGVAERPIAHIEHTAIIRLCETQHS